MSSAPPLKAPPPSALPGANAVARTAATLVVVRDGDQGIEVLLLRRAERGDHSSGAWVFPGGVLDARDREWHACCHGVDDFTASTRLGLSEGGLDYHVAAIRECFEESGLLLAHGADGALVALDADAGAAIGAWRGLLHRGERTMGEFCRHFGLTLAVDQMVYFSRWVTPLARAKRWDTRFFVARAPEGQASAHDEVELVEQRWLRPEQALAQGDAMKMLTPTRSTLEELARFDTVDALLDYARSPRPLPATAPRIATGRIGAVPITPEHPAWAEIGRLDPQRRGDASYDIVPGTAVRLSPHVIRVTCGNPGMMTGPGTNTYLVGGGARNEWAVIDPGPEDPAHTERILAAAPGPIRLILVTHTHHDHSPGAVLLEARTGAPVAGRVADHTQNQDPTFAPERVLRHDERVDISDGVALRVVHTPGHASNHLCFLLESERLLFTGDHLMQGSTVVIGPPDGDMGAYLTSLRGLLALDLEWLAPAHGFMVGQPVQMIERTVAHRLAREAKVVDALRALGPAPMPTLLARVYDDVQPHLHAMATRSLTAHLLKLRDEARAVENDGAWALAAGAA